MEWYLILLVFTVDIGIMNRCVVAVLLGVVDIIVVVVVIVILLKCDWLITGL
jgi:hypothetical protein